MVEAFTEKTRTQERNDNLRTASIMCLLANINRDPKKRKKPYTTEDFMPRVRKQQTPQDMLNTVKAMNKAYGGKGGK